MFHQVRYRRVGKIETGRADDLRTLSEQFLFPGASSDRLAKLLWEAPLIGDDSIFGEHPEARAEDATDVRHVSSFSPAPGFRFDVEMRRHDAGTFLMGFRQPTRIRPYLSGDFVWFVTQSQEGALFDEQINTARALEVAANH